MAPPDPTAGAGGDDTGGDDGTVTVVTICKAEDGSYIVYTGDKPDGGADLSADDADAMGAAGGGPAGGAPPPGGGGMGGGDGGQPADSIGSALKIAMDIMNEDKSSEGAPGNSDDQLNAGFTASKSPTPASGPSGQKY
jgi:hypothetical protein